MKPTRTKTLLLASSIALLTTPAYAWTNEAHVLGGRAEFTDTNAKRRHHAKPRQAKAHYAKARHAKQQQIKRRAVERRNRSKTAHQPAGYDAFASLPDQHAVATGYDQHAVVMTGSYVPVRHTPTRVKRRTVERQAVERKSRPQGVRQHAGYDLIASQQRDQHSVEQGFYYPPVNYAPARRTPTPYASAHHAPPPIRSATRSHRVARTYHTEPATERQAVERKSRPQAARQHAGYDAFASLPDQHAVVHGYSYAPARRAPAPYASTHYAPARSHAATRAHTVAHTYHIEPGSSGGSDLVARARQYMGTNPTGWARVWCGRFMAMIAPDAAARIGNPNFALNWAKLPRTGLQIGAIAVLSRNGGGHVGVVSGIDAHGNPIIISGNHNKRVAEAVYPRSRVYAYVRPY